MKITIYHNPRCSKSRQTLALLNDKGIEPEVVLYLDNTPSINTLKTLVKQLGFDSPRQMMRVKETEYKELNLANAEDNTLLEAMLTHPKLIERPIVVNGNKAALGRPPENVLEIIS